MAARMWRHGIHSFIELLRYRLPSSNDHFQRFLIEAYSIISLMLETVPAFRETWVEMLGDLARYKYAVETDVEDKSHWGKMSSDWYLEAAKTQPTTGRLYHHLGILAQPKGIEALFYYIKSLCVRKPFPSASQSILLFPQHFLKDDSSSELPPFQAEYLKLHGLLLSDELDQSEDVAHRFSDLLALHIRQEETIDTNLLNVAWQMAIVNSAAILGYGLKEKLQITRFSLAEDIIMVNSEDEDHWDSVLFLRACYLHNLTVQVALSVRFCHHMRPFLHVTLLFLYKMVRVIGTHKVLDFPWQPLATFLNDLLDDLPNCSLMANEIQPLPEDFGLRGLLFAEDYFPETWFDRHQVWEDPSLGLHTLDRQRRLRMIWIAKEIAKMESPLLFDPQRNCFMVGAISNEGKSHLLGTSKWVEMFPRKEEDDTTFEEEGHTTFEEGDDIISEEGDDSTFEDGAAHEEGTARLQ